MTPCPSRLFRLFLYVAGSAIPLISLAQSSPSRSGLDVQAEHETDEQAHQRRETQLSQGVQAYQRGNREEALAILSALAAEPAVKGTSLQLEAMIYLGEIHYIQGDEQNARSFFEIVILSNPKHVLDPFRHPPDVAAFFNQVKLTMDLSSVEVAPLSIRPGIPAWSPLGVYHFRQDRRTRGWMYMSGQVITGVTSVVLSSLLLGKHDWEQGGIPYNEDDTAYLQQLERIQRFNLISFLGFYGMWGASVIDAHRHWQIVRTESLQTNQNLPPIQLQVQLTRRW